MKRTIVSLLMTFAITGCCNTYSGYGRYLMKACDTAVIDGTSYEITRRDADFVVEGHTIPRGIYRKTRPWLYLHHIEGNLIDITFDSGAKDIYPLYTGSSGSIFDVFSQPWEMTRSTNALIGQDYWLISHRWSDNGIYFDLQHMEGDVTAWTLVRGDIFVPADGTEVSISEIHTKVKINSFNAAQQKALVQFSAM